MEQQLDNTDVADIRDILFQLIEEQLKIGLLAQTRQEFALETIDPALAPEEKIAPKRALIAIIGTLLGAILGVLIIYGQHVLTTKQK